MTDPWTMPAWMEPYRRLIVVSGGHSVEAVMNSGTQHANFNDAVRQIAVAHQVALLKSLMAAGLLLVAVPAKKPKAAPSRQTRAKRAKRRRR